MNITDVAITETMEQVHKFCAQFLAIHRDIEDEGEVLARAIRERYGDVDPRAVLERAEINSLAAARRRMISDPRKNPFVETSAQGDLFNTVTLRVPSILICGDGKPRPYYEASILDGLEWWRARQDAKADEAARYREAANVSEDASRDADEEAAKLEELVRAAQRSGIDPHTVLYAKAQH